MIREEKSEGGRRKCILQEQNNERMRNPAVKREMRRKNRIYLFATITVLLQIL